MDNNWIMYYKPKSGRFARSVPANFTSANGTIGEIEDFTTAYLVVPIISVLLCIIAVGNNIKILASVSWIKRPLTPTLYISLSLSLADTCTAILIALGFIFNSFLPKGLKIEVKSDCLNLVVEALRLSGIIISTAHLLLLAGNHYLGIIFPFRSKQWFTRTNLLSVILGTWLAPTAYIFAYFSSFTDQGFQRKDCHIDKEKFGNYTLVTSIDNFKETSNFLGYSRFRMIFSALFFIPLVIMFAIYFHITIIVQRHQANRQWYNRHKRRPDGSGNENPRMFERNVKAIVTSLLILSTYIFCFMPAVLQFCLVCYDCVVTFDSIATRNLILMSSITNILLILKYLLNPLIYASRMQEIKVATKQMNTELRKRLCQCRGTEEPELGAVPRERAQRVSLFSGSSRRTNIILNSLQKKRAPRERGTKKLETTSL